MFEHTPLVLNAKDGEEFRLAALTKAFALRHSAKLLAIHSLIPRLSHWTVDDLLADGVEGRQFTGKWELSAAILPQASDDPIGFIISYFRRATNTHPFDSVYIHRMALLKQYQRRGIGSAASSIYLKQLFSALPWLQHITVQTNATPDNEHVIQFYQQLGFYPFMHVFYREKVDWLFVTTRTATRPDTQPLTECWNYSITHPFVPSCTRGTPRLFFSTSNEPKYQEFRFLFSCYNFELVRILPPIDLIEPQVEYSAGSDEQELVFHPLRLAARFLESRSSLPFIIEDTMLFIEFFNRDFSRAELPGHDTKRWWRQLGDDGVLSLMRGSSRRKARYVSQLGAYLGQGEYVYGRGEVLGTINQDKAVSQASYSKVPATSPWFFHSIFIPDGAKQTLAEMAVEDFVQFDYKRRAVVDFLGRVHFDLPEQLTIRFQ